MSRWRVVEIVSDDGAFGYVAPSIMNVKADYLTRAEAKAIMKYYFNSQVKEAKKGNTLWLDNVDYEVEVLQDGDWHNVSHSWAYRSMEEQERWFDEMGWDYMAWQMHTPETPYDFKNKGVRVNG